MQSCVRHHHKTVIPDDASLCISSQAPLVKPADTLSPVRIGNIYQRFGSLQSGLCQNIIKASVPFLLEEGMYTYATALDVI